MTRSKPLRISGPAERDLGQIAAYTEERWGRRQRRKYLAHLKDGFQNLRAQPAIGAPRDDIDQGLRALNVENHVVFYRDTEAAIVIVRVLHRNMDAPRHLAPD